MRASQTMQVPRPKDRIFMLGEDVNQDSVREIIKAIYDINLDDEEKESVYTEYERMPIHLILNTYGGSVYDGLALIGAIELSATPVIITCLGSAMSMGLYILASGHHRRAHHLSTIMYHEMTIGAIDKLKGIKDDIKESERIEKLCESLMLMRTKLKLKDVSPYKERKADWYMSASEALKYGIIDEIIGNPLVSPANIKEMEKQSRAAAKRVTTKKSAPKRGSSRT